MNILISFFLVEDCDFKATEKMQFVQHYIGKRHGILEKYISEELQSREGDPELSEVAMLLVNISKPFQVIKNIKEETINEPVEAEQEIEDFSSKSSPALLTHVEESNEQINNEIILGNIDEEDFTNTDHAQKMSDLTSTEEKPEEIDHGRVSQNVQKKIIAFSRKKKLNCHFFS